MSAKNMRGCCRVGSDNGVRSLSRIELGPDDVRRLNWFGAKPLIAGILAAPLINPALLAIGRVLLPERVARRLPLNQRAATYRLDDGSSIKLLDPRHDLIARDIYWGGGKSTDPAERHKLSALEHLSKSAALFVDVGAYAGFCSLIAARANPNLKALAYEIVPENFLLLVRNVIANDLAQRVEPRLRGIGEMPGSMKLPVGFGAASLMSSISLGSEFADGVSIAIEPLDKELAAADGPILMKTDVEGFEDRVLCGGVSMIRRHRPDIICEILPGAHESCATIAKILSPLGYRSFCFEAGGAEPRDGPEPAAGMRDWLFTTKDRWQ
jgi:FkbM family methyltransferase